MSIEDLMDRLISEGTAGRLQWSLQELDLNGGILCNQEYAGPILLDPETGIYKKFQTSTVSYHAIDLDPAGKDIMIARRSKHLSGLLNGNIVHEGPDLILSGRYHPHYDLFGYVRLSSGQAVLVLDDMHGDSAEVCKVDPIIALSRGSFAWSPQGSRLGGISDKGELFTLDEGDAKPTCHDIRSMTHMCFLDEETIRYIQNVDGQSVMSEYGTTGIKEIAKDVVNISFSPDRRYEIVSFPGHEMITGDKVFRKIPNTRDAQIGSGCWSPDSRNICYPDKEILWNYEIETGRSKILFSEFPVKPVRWR